MRRKTRLFCVAMAVTAWAFSGLAKSPLGDPSGRKPHPSGPPARPSGERGRPMPLPAPSGSVDVSELLRRGQLRSEALRARMAELDATRSARKLERIEAFRSRYSPAVLADPRVKNELRAHARRMAMLHRAELVANELEEPKRAKVLARVKMLSEREQARHERRMEKARRAFPAGSVSGRRPVSPPPKGSAP